VPQSPTARMLRVSFFVSAGKCISATFRCHPTRLGERTGRRSWQRRVSLHFPKRGSKRVAILPMYNSKSVVGERLIFPDA